MDVIVRLYSSHRNEINNFLNDVIEIATDKDKKLSKR